MLAPLFSIFLIVAAFTGQQPSVRFNPQVVSVVRDSTGYVQSMVSVFSVKGDSIRITDIKGSCGCATASVQRPVMHDSIPGKIYLSINARHFTDSLNYVDYLVTHTGAGSPTGYRVVVRLPKETR
ncbi:MAG: hypothetical protein NTX15_07370 [Candidatus Kapabacteria bacterium]|nr:hypothetical protein [Candidatus Kapabacteria bacterium]